MEITNANQEKLDVAIEKFNRVAGRDKMIICSIEELAELSQALTKELRGKSDINHLAEECADVIFSLNSIYKQFPEVCKLINPWLTYKTKRSIRRNNETLYASNGCLIKCSPSYTPPMDLTDPKNASLFFNGITMSSPYYCFTSEVNLNWYDDRATENERTVLRSIKDAKVYIYFDQMPMDIALSDMHDEESLKNIKHGEITEVIFHIYIDFKEIEDEVMDSLKVNEIYLMDFGTSAAAPIVQDFSRYKGKECLIKIVQKVNQ